MTTFNNFARRWIWAHTASPPQHIGTTDATATAAQVLAEAAANRHRYDVALIVTESADVHLFDTNARAEAWLTRNAFEPADFARITAA